MLNTCMTQSLDFNHHIDAFYTGSQAKQSYVIAISDGYTPEGYKKELVEKVLAAKSAKKIRIPSDEKGFLAWLKAKRV